jgi:ADP-ribosylglycohydrolase
MDESRAWDLVLDLSDGSELVDAPTGVRAEPGRETRDRFLATLLGGALGDALGRPVERWDRAEVRRRYPDGVREFQPWHGWASGPIGTITDDTQLSLAVAGWLRDAGGASVPPGDDFGRRVAEWGPVARGAGMGSATAAANLAAGVPWWESGSRTYGNGVAMRSAAIGLRYQGDVERIRTAVAVSGLATHRHPSAIAGGLVMATVTSHLLTVEYGWGHFDAETIIDAALFPLTGLELPLHPRGGSDEQETLIGLINRIEDRLDWDVEDAFDYFYNGSAIFQSLPMALWLFCRFGENEPEELLVTAASGGRDADTIAAMAGNWAGALHGLSAFPSRWTGPELEYRDELLELGSDLYDLWLADQGEG